MGYSTIQQGDTNEKQVKTVEELNLQMMTIAHKHEQERRDHLRGEAKDLLQKVHINRAESITVKPGASATATAEFTVALGDKVPLLSGVTITVSMGWGTCDDAIKTLDAVLSTITNALEPVGTTIYAAGD
jgi:hypothetical protein